jgi:hypothetical protein
MVKQMINDGGNVYCECESGHKVTLCRLTTCDLDTYAVDEVSHECLSEYTKTLCPKCPREDDHYLMVDFNKITWY